MIVRREISKAITATLKQYPVIALTGPRQSGKTTLLKDLLSDYTYISLENPDNRDFALNDPNGFLSRYSSRVIIDEAQRVPSLFSYIQTLVDESGEMGQFILSGSQNFQLLQEITQSLAGRVAIFKLLPFDFQEMQSENLLNEDYLKAMVRGYYPALFERGIDSSKYYSNYVQTYVQRDISDLVGIRNLSQFKRFLGVVATRAGQLLNINDMAKVVGITAPTAKSWLSALESSYIIFLLPPYHENFGKRLIKSPKLYFYDTGLLCHLLRIKESEDLITHPIKGALFENMMIAEFIKRNQHKDLHIDAWFWRDSNGHEVDLLYTVSGQLHTTEIKASKTVTTSQFKGLMDFKSIAKNKKVVNQLVYSGDEQYERSHGHVISWRHFCK